MAEHATTRLIKMLNGEYDFDMKYKDGAFTSNDPKVRAYAVQKIMNAIDLCVELGAKFYVLWGGREGTKTDAAKDPITAIKRSREAMNFLCEYVLYQGYAAADGSSLKFALKAKPNEPRGDIYNSTTGRTSPGPEKEVYVRNYPVYRNLYPALKPTFISLAE